MAKDVIIACDFAGKKEVLDFLELFGEQRPFVKIGMELFYAEGPVIVRELKARGHRVFLDLKVHDIPHTVQKTMTVLARLGADIVNVHAAGAGEMMRAALRGLEEGSREADTACYGEKKRPLLIAVTQLTSTDDTALRQELLIEKPMEKVVSSYAKNARINGLDGVVCSPQEARGVHAACGKDFLTVTPGIRFANADQGDQKRVMTPAQARIEGSDYIVVGRPITGAADPVASYRRCLSDFLTDT